MSLLGIFRLLSRVQYYIPIPSFVNFKISGFALNDSPMGLAAYILEKFSTWTDRSAIDTHDGKLTHKFSYDELLTNVIIYWTTKSIGTSQRFYKECFRHEKYAEFNRLAFDFKIFKFRE